MKQGQVAPKGKWTGNPHGGPKPPPYMVLPDPGTRFINTARRLEMLADGHPMADWLRFMARIAEAQHVAATTSPSPTILEPRFLASVAEARLPPLAVDGHRRSPVWRDGLAVLLENIDRAELPQAAADVIDDLRFRHVDTVESLAHDHLAGTIAKSDIGAALYVAAALQVYFTRLAATLDASLLRPLKKQGLCPCCGSPPVSGIVTASGTTPGTRYLTCALCTTMWNHVRAVCISCGSAQSLSLRAIEGGSEAIKAEACGACQSYSKILDQRQDAAVDPFADDLASLGLDVLIAEAGFARHAPSPLLI